MFSVPASLSCLSFFISSFFFEKIFVEFSEYVGNAFPHCIDVSRFVPHMRDENFFSCLMRSIKFYSTEFFKMSCIFSCLLDLLFVSDTLFD